MHAQPSTINWQNFYRTVRFRFATNWIKLAYQYLQVLKRHFWQRWSEEYVSQQQLRRKWHRFKQNLKTDDIVLIKKDNLPHSR